MSVVAPEALRAYVHPHHGIAVADPGVEIRKVGGRSVAMITLDTVPVQSWAFLAGIHGNATPSAGPFRSLVPAEAVESGKSAWAQCPRVDLDKITDA